MNISSLNMIMPWSHQRICNQHWRSTNCHHQGYHHHWALADSEHGPTSWLWLHETFHVADALLQRQLYNARTYLRDSPLFRKEMTWNALKEVLDTLSQPSVMAQTRFCGSCTLLQYCAPSVEKCCLKRLQAKLFMYQLGFGHSMLLSYLSKMKLSTLGELINWPPLSLEPSWCVFRVMKLRIRSHGAKKVFVSRS